MSEPAIVGQDVVLGYPGHIAVDTSDFSIPRGGITAIIGPNGSGKSTLLSAIAGLLEPISGTIDIPGSSRHDARISYVLQTTKVNDALPVTVREVVAMGRYSGMGRFQRMTPVDRAAVLTAMQRTGVDGISGQHLQQLSGGQRQRVMVSQGLAQDHDILLLDEPLSGIDMKAAQAIDDVIHDEISEGCSVVLTTHDLSEARVADHVILMGGRVIAEGSAENVLTETNLSAAYGASMLHSHGQSVVLDDPAHVPIPGRHSHRERSNHPEATPSEVHSGE
jgi:ABC-type Mn2+/Zn2+ transport system ATPase subunit